MGYSILYSHKGGGGGRKIPGLPSTISHLGDLIHSQPGEGRSLPPPHLP